MVISFSAVPLYDPESQFSMSSLHRLESVGINIVTSLKEIYMQVMAATGIIPEYLMPRLTKSMTYTECLEIIVDEWVLEGGLYLPTWRSLLTILEQLNLKHLGQQIEDYFYGMKFLLAILCCASYHLYTTQHWLQQWEGSACYKYRD